jgi:hypothetical protein
MLTQEDKQLIAEFMGWVWIFDYFCTRDDIRFLNRKIHFDLNDASLCANKMLEKRDWEKYLNYCYVHNSAEIDFIAFIFIADNFFASMAAWLRERKEERNEKNNKGTPTIL